jgi:hypothetical protein
MSKHIDEHINLFDAISILSETMKNITRRDMKETHSCYRELGEELKKQEELVEQQLEAIPKESKVIIKEYIVGLQDLHNYEGDHFYLKGYSDCIRLLHRLNVLK